MSSFFVRKAGKRKGGVKKPASGNKKFDSKKITTRQSKVSRPEDDEEIESNSEIESSGDEGDASHCRELEEETAEDKKLRLARLYLNQLANQEEENRVDGLLDDGDFVAKKLRDEALEAAGKLQRRIADSFISPAKEDVIFLRGHRLTPTCVVLSQDSKIVFSGSKDGSILKWDVVGKKKLYQIRGRKKSVPQSAKTPGHSGQVLCLAISSDGKFLASGCSHNAICIWNPKDCIRLHTFSGHRGAISGLQFRYGTHTLFSSSHDRTVKIWTVDEMAYVETLFGHQAEITGVDSLSRERAITCGGRDNTVRIWKVPEESQLVFNGHGGSIDCVRLINEENFVSGSDDGSVAVWTVRKKKPLLTVRRAHGRSPGPRAGTEGNTNWISAVAALRNSDLIATGSCDGFLRLWQAGEEFRTLKPLMEIKVDGFVNDIQFSTDGSILVFAVGPEHKFGRWWHAANVPNQIGIVHLRRKAEA